MRGEGPKGKIMLHWSLGLGSSLRDAYTSMRWDENLEIIGFKNNRHRLESSQIHLYILV